MQFNGTISGLVQTTRDLELQGHATLQVTFAISGTIHVRAMTFFCFYGFSGQAIQRHYQWPCTKTLQVTFAISGTIHVRAMTFFLFLRFLGSSNSMALSVTLYKQRVTLNFKVTRPYRWPLLSRALYMLERWLFFLFLRFFGSAKSME